MKLFDMLSGMELDCEDADGGPDETETFSGRLKFKTKEFLRPQYEVYMLGVIADNELRCYAYLVDVTQQEKERRSLTKLQATRLLWLLRKKVFRWKFNILHDRLKLAEEQKTNRKIRFGKVCSLLFFSR